MSSPSSPSSEVKLLIAVAGIYSCFLTFAVNTEGLFSYRAADGSKFSATLFFLLVQCLTNTALAGAAVLALGTSTRTSGTSTSGTSTSGTSTSTSSDKDKCKSEDKEQAVAPSASASVSASPPALDYVTAGVSYICAMLCSTEALKFVSLPMQALGKSCKMVPVMLFGFLIRGKRYSFRETLAVLLITAGITVFQQKKSSSSGSAVGGEHANYGLALLFLSLVLDGVTGACQDRMRERYHPSTHQMMFHMNLYATLLLAGLVTVTGQLTEGLAFCSANPQVVYFIVLAALTMAAGQNFIFYTLANFDALTLATITTTRKFFTIIVSTIYYQHQFGQSQQLGVGLVFMGLLLELANKHAAKQQRLKDAADERLKVE